MNREEMKIYLAKIFPHCRLGENGDFPVMFVNRNELYVIAQKLKDDPCLSFDFLFCETALDFKDHFEVIYHLTSTVLIHNLEIKINLADRNNAEIDSVVPIWKAAELYECEIYDLFGIRFLNHPNLRRIFLGDQWQGYPLRKDYNEINNLIL